MQFTSIAFVILFLATFCLYYLPFLAKVQVHILIAASLIFYAYSQPVLLLLLLASALINIVSSYYVVYGSLAHRKKFAVAGVVFNLLILIFFKYSPMLATNLFDTSGGIGAWLLQIPLPIGISFFTFQGISLIVDVYKEKYFRGADIVPRSFVVHARRILFFKSFFPQLISGPIVKAHEFLPQVGRKRFSDIQWEDCFKLLVTGYFLKMVIADNLKDQTFWIAFPYFQNMSSATLVVLLFGYSMQIFADFAGYSLIAMGLGALLGYRLPVNFNFPYIAASFSDFWRRWHISLSTFLREYLYIPLGGNRKGAVRTYINLMLTMVLGGLWHGAAWSYAVWGGVHGAALAVERFLGNYFKMTGNVAMRVSKIVFVFLFVTCAWLLFKLPDFHQVIRYFEAIHDNSHVENKVQIISYIFLYSLPVIFYHLFYLFFTGSRRPVLQKMEFVFYGIMVFFIVLNSGSPGAFIYFQF